MNTHSTLTPPSAPLVPLVSVVLPIRNEARFIRRCLEAVLAQDYPADRMELIVVDGMSTDGTREIAESFSARHPALRVISNAGQIVPTGLNAAIAVARGEIVVRVDGHCEIATDYVSQCVHHLQSGVDAVGGPLETIGDTVIANAIAIGMSSTFGVGNSAFRTSSGKTLLVDTVAFPAYTKSALDRLGPFDEELVRNQDDEYNYRLRKSGGQVLLAATVRSKYFSRSSLRSLWRQYFQYGYWKVRVLQKHPRQMCARQFAPPLFVGGSLTLIVSSLFFPVARWALLGTAALYALAALMASAQRARGRVRLLAVLPVIFLILHVSYGSGFLTGLIAFRGRWRRRRSVATVTSADRIAVRTS